MMAEQITEWAVAGLVCGVAVLVIVIVVVLVWGIIQDVFF